MASATKKNKRSNPKHTKAPSRAKKPEKWLAKQMKDMVVPQQEEVQEERDDELENAEIDTEDLPVVDESHYKESQHADDDANDDDDDAATGVAGPNDKSRVIYVGHLPYGFEEQQIKEFFSQFGEVQRSCVSRSAKTGRSRGFAFVEFLHPEIAQIVADSMHDYFLFKKRLVCRQLPETSAGKVRWQTGPLAQRTLFSAQRRAAERYNQQNKTKTLPMLIKLQASKEKRLAKHGIDYNFDGLALVEKALVEKALAEKALAEKALAEKALAEKALVKKAPAQKAPAQKAPAQKARAEKPLAQKARAEKALAQKVLAEPPLAETPLAETALAEKRKLDTEEEQWEKRKLVKADNLDEKIAERQKLREKRDRRLRNKLRN